MKIPIKKKDFEDKANLEKALGTKLKKPVSALVKKTVDKLPFCYEVDYFSEGKGFMSIGVAKEVDKLFKTKRVKGQGTKGKIDKKKVAYGTVSINAEGVFEFCVLGGMMKGMQAKKVIKSIGILKKMIGDNFVIVKGEATVEESTEGTTEGSADKDANKAKGAADKGKNDAKVAKRTAQISKMKENVAKMDKAVGTAPKEKLEANIQKYEDALATLVTQANADGEVDANEQKAIDELTAELNALKENIAKQDGGNKKGSGKKMTPERKATIKKNMDKISARLDDITKKLGIA